MIMPSALTLVCHSRSLGSATTRGLKARATLAWGNAPDIRPATTRGLKARAKTLIPHKLLIESHAILCKHRPHLALKITLPMMLRLPVDISHQRRAIAQPNRKRRISALPTELRKLSPLGLDPLRGRHLHPLNQFRHRLRPREEQRNMNVIVHASHTYAYILGTAEARSQVRMHLASDFIGQQRPSLLHAKDQMHQYVGKRLRRGNNSNADPQPAPVTGTTTWGCAPGYENAGRRPANPSTQDN
jgi:hypothetical protein